MTYEAHLHIGAVAVSLAFARILFISAKEKIGDSVCLIGDKQTRKMDKEMPGS